MPSAAPLPTACGLTRADIKQRIEAAVLTELNPTGDRSSWTVSRHHPDDFTRDTDNLVCPSFVVQVGRSAFDDGRQYRVRSTGPKQVLVRTQVNVQVATRLKADDVREDETAHLAWVDAVTRAAMTASQDHGQLLYTATAGSVAFSTAQVAVTTVELEYRHLLPLE